MQRFSFHIGLLICALGLPFANAQQGEQGPPAPAGSGPQGPFPQGAPINARRPLNAPPVFDHTGAMQNPRVQIQPNQRGLVNRDAQRQGLPANGNINNRDPRERIAAERRIAEQINAQNDTNQQGPNEIDPNVFAGGGGSYYGSSGPVTAAEGLIRADGEFVRSVGEYNQATATAGVLTEKAEEQSIQNRYDAVDNYFDVRRLNRQQRNAERGPTPTQEDVLRYSQDRLPQRLPLASLDRNSGAITWPAVLRRPEFDEHRARLEQVFQGRSYYNSGAASQSYLEIKEEADRMLLTLQDRVYEMDPFAYVQAKKFITGLSFEGRFVAGNDSLASR
jgi:hypothetical protein